MAKFKQLLKGIQRRISYFVWLFLDPSKFVRIDHKRIKRILVINLGFIGDLLATTPMISALKNKFNAEVSVLVNKQMKEVLHGNKEISKVITYKGKFSEDLENLQREDFDLAVIVWPGSLKVSLLCLLARIPYRIGTTQTGLLEGKGYFLTRKVWPSLKEKHKVLENLDIAGLVGAEARNPKVDFSFSKEDERFVGRFLSKEKIREPIVVIHAGKRGKFYAEYSWSLENFARVADFLVDTYGASIILSGGTGEEAIAEKICGMARRKKKVHVVAGKFNLGQFAALLKRSRLLISIDTATVHIASTSPIKVPMVILNVKYPRIWHPYIPKDRYKILNRPTIREVESAAGEFLGKNLGRK